MKRFMFILWRDFGSQVRTSRNLHEGIGKKLRRLFWCAVYFFKAVLIGLRSMRREQIGSEVEYQGKRVQVSNWAGSEFPTLAGDGFYQQNVPRAEIKNITGVREYLHRFLYGFSFYTGSWMGIDVQRRLYK